jgi:LacI family transcriptional regulator
MIGYESGVKTAREVTISDIAQWAGVGKATVSRALNGSGYVGAEARRRIEEAVAALGYTPSAAARALSTRQTSLIGLVIPEVSNSFFAEIILGIGQVVEQNNLVLMLSNTDNNAATDLKVLQTMRQQRLRGLIYTPAVEYEERGERERMIRLLGQIGAPVVVLDRPLRDAQFDEVCTDNHTGAYLSAKALIEAGHRRIGIVAGDMRLNIGRERFEGFRQALADHGIELKEEDILYGEFDQNRTYALTRAMLETEDYPTAFFVSNNLSSKGFIRALFEKGKRIPDDVAYIGFDRVDGLELFGLQYSCLDRDVPHMGAMAMRLLLDRIDDPKKPRERIVASPVLRLTGSEKRWR